MCSIVSPPVTSSDGHEGGPAPRSPGLVRAVTVASVEAAALLVYAALIGLVALGGSTEGSAPPVEVAIFGLLAVGIGLVAKGLWARRHLAFGPFVLTQLFGLVVGGTLVAGGSTLTRVLGIAVLLLALLGLAQAMSATLREELVD